MSWRRGTGAVLLVVGVLAGCGDSSASEQPSNGDIDRITQHVHDLNTAYERLRIGVNSCPVGAAPAVLATCFDQAYASSGVDSVLSDFDREVRRVETHLGSGDCRSAMGRFDTTLVALRRAVATMKHDFDAGNISRMVSDGQTVQDAWKASVRGEAQADKPC
jgi:outer membrane murein-binding lipoprotein Lpp